MASRDKRKNRSLLKLWLSAVIFMSVIFSAHAKLTPNGGFGSPYFQADYVQNLTSFNSSMINPALIYRVNQINLQFGGYRWNLGSDIGEASDLGYQQFTLLYPVRLNQTIGISFIGTGSSIDKKDIRLGSIEDVGTSRFGDIWAVLHYGVRLSRFNLPWLMLGLNPKFVYQRQFDNGNDVGWGLDVGIYANPFDHYRFGDLGFSLTLQDVKPATLNWGEGDNSFKYVNTTRFRAGLRYSALNDRVVVASEFVLDNALADLWEALGTFDPADTAQPIGDQVNDFLDKVGRVGVYAKVEFIPQLWLKAGWANNNVPYLGVNFNLIFPLPEMINYVHGDVHIGYSVNEPERGLSMMGKLSMDVGPTREQRESKRMYDRLILAPMDAYMEAMRLYLAGKYWDAGFAFGKVISLFPNFHLNDKATYYLGDCYSKLKLNDIAREIYKEGLAEYTTSEQRAKYLYGLEALDYREGRYEDALKNHAFISNLYPESEIISDADYIAAQVYFARKNYNAAEQILRKIQPDALTYNYAQYTLSIVNIENGKVNEAIKNLQVIVEDTTDDLGELLLQDAANNKLGQLYFEQVELRKAVEAFDRVPEGSPYGDEALMGIAWSWIKVNKPELALQTINRLLVAHDESPLVPEGYLVKGYSLMLPGSQQNNRAAITALEKSIEMCKKDFASEDALAARKRKLDAYIAQFAPISDEIKKNAFRKPTDKTIAERGDLKVKYDEYAGQLNDFFNFSLLVEDNKKFFRRKDQILADAEYALAKAYRIVGSAKDQKIIKKTIKQTEDIDKEIQKLKEQLGE